MQKWAAVNENDINNKARNVSLVFERRKCKINIIAFIAEEICSWLSPFHKQTASLFSLPTKVTAKKNFFSNEYRYYYTYFAFSVL